MELLPARKPSIGYTVVGALSYVLVLVALGLFLLWGSRK